MGQDTGDAALRGRAPDGLSIVDCARRHRTWRAVDARRSRGRSDRGVVRTVRRASSGRPPVCASATTARHPRRVPDHAGRLHARPRRRWPARLCTIGRAPWNGAQRIPTIGVPADIAAQHGIRIPRPTGRAGRHRLPSDHEYWIFGVPLSSRTFANPFLFGNDR